MNTDFEYIVVGSGPCGVQAAQTIAEAGKNIAVLDVGFADEHYHRIVPDDDFENLRRNDASQYRYFLGDKFESVMLEEMKAGAQLTPPRKHIIKGVENLTPVESDTFFPMESLGYGGLGAGWGLGCLVYSDKELAKAGLNPAEFRKAYEVINERVGISCAKDNASEYTTSYLNNILPPLKMDNAVAKLYAKYLEKKDYLAKQNVFAGNAPLAMLSVDYKKRKKTEYKDMDFYTDKDLYAYRAWMTIEEIKKHPNFTYINKVLVLRFTEQDSVVKVEGKNVDTNETVFFTCRKLLLAAGPLGSARIVLRSFPEKVKRLPLLCNPYSYVPCIQTRMLGKPLDRFKSSMAQMIMLYDINRKHDDVVAVALYTYRSLLLNKLAKEAPIDFAGSRIIMQYLQSAFVIAGIFHTDELSPEKYLELHPDTAAFSGDKLFAHYKLSESEKQKVKSSEAVIKKALRKLGCYAVMRMDPGAGASIHYAGTLPFGENKEEYGTTSNDGKLNGTKNIFVADGSGMRFLPAKGITFTIMANAYNVANKAMTSDE